MESTKRCLKYWLRLLKMPNDRYVKKAYSMLVYYSDFGYVNWATKVKNVLYSNGFGYVLANQCVHNERSFLQTIIQRLNDQYLQTWTRNIANNHKLILYRGFKNSFSTEAYLGVGAEMATPKTSIPKMSTVPKCLLPKCLLCQNVYSQNVYSQGRVQRVLLDKKYIISRGHLVNI